jgi:cell wall-associated NlpC family hydrolase
MFWRIRPKVGKALGAAAAAVAAGVLLALVVGPHVIWGGDSSGDAVAATPLAPPPWAANPDGKPGGKAPGASTTTTSTTAAAKPAPIDPVTGMPAASAGTNGSYAPPPPSERKRVYSATHPVGGVPSSLLLNRTALAPPSAPDPVKAMISAANLIVGQPYQWGGGHASFQSRGYDCSGAVSYALAGAGLLQTPLSSGQFMGYGEPGPGQWLTIYANPNHVYAVIAGLRWDTVGDARGSGPRWHPYDAYPSGFVARHVPGL